MLTAIIVERLGVIERAELELGSGSVALTGETGAGKTLVVSAASLLLGARADRSLIRAGCDDAVVQGLFLVPPDHPVLPRLRARGIPATAGENGVEIVVARRIAIHAGRNRVRINGILVPAALLGEIGSMLVEIAGQNEHSRLAHPAHQRVLLDAFAGSSDVASRVAELVRRARAASAEAKEIGMAERERQRELDALRHEVAEIDRVAPKPGEMVALEASAARLERAAELAEGAARVSQSVRGEGGAEELLAEAADVLQNLARFEPRLEEPAGRLRSAGLDAGDVAAEVAGIAADTDPAMLEDVHSRIGALRALRRRYGADEDAVRAHATWARTRIAELEDAEHAAEGLHESARDAEAEARALAAELGQRRAAATTALRDRVEAILGSLALPGAHLEVELVPSDLYEGGAETVEFRIATNPGEGPGPLVKVSSGGELSRLALALNVVTTAGTTRTMIFDEVDSGVGGSAAAEVGRSLARLAEGGMQVIVVTHLPQVAAFASEHHVVSKEIDGDRARAMVRRVDGEARVAEVARMLAGLPDSERGRDHARELLQLSSSGVSAA